MDARKQNDPCGGVLALPSTVRLDAPGATAPATRSRALSAAEEAAENNSHAERERRVILHAMRVSLWVWPAFALLDVYMCLVLYPGAPLLLFAAYRAAIEAVLYAVYRIVRRRSAPLRVLRALERGAFFLAAFVIALMAIHLGGLRSAYMHGISLVCLVHAAVMPHPWRQSLVSFLPIGLIFPVVMGVAAAVSPSERAEWYSLESLAIFASHYVFVAASAVVGLASGHAVWTAQQQLYRARKLGRYRLQAPIGAGGMGEVWLAWDGVLRRNVALKFLRVGGPLTRELVRRFEREARAASQLRGPHTARIFDFGASDDGICYIVMEYLAGADLHALVQRHGPLDPARAVALAIQACLALEEAHDAGIVHRDIKPQNLFVTPARDGQELVKLLDFGLARFHTVEASVQLTHAGLLLGTPAYMAPELWQGGAADPRSDLYALGATLYFLLAGAPPFEGTAAGDFLRAHVARRPEPPSARRGSALPEGLDSIVLRCLEKAPAARFQAARDLRAALSAVGASART